MTKILITNDDGIHAEGIRWLADALDELGEVTVLAPERNWSASGHPKTLHKPLRIQPVQWTDGRTVYACSGAPSDCVALALMGAVQKPFDLVVSGINSNYNLGSDVLYSGTVAAAMEAIISDVPAVAVSLAPGGEGEILNPAANRHAAWVTQGLVQAVLRYGLPAHCLLNVNVPRASVDNFAGMAWTRLGRRIYRDELVVRDDPWGRPYYWIGGEIPSGVPDDGTDIGTVEQGVVSVTPLGIDLTRQDLLPRLAEWRIDWPLEPAPAAE
jgi:5'-nucleotidase